MAELRAVLFDVYGTLFTTAGVLPGAMAAGADFMRLLDVAENDRPDAGLALRNGHAQATAEFVQRPFYGHRDMIAAGYTYAAESLLRPMSAADAQLLAIKFFDVMFGNSPLRDGAIETLTALRKRGLHLGAVSNSDEDQLEMMLVMGGVGEYFDSRLCSETARSCKPHPEIFHQALRQANCAPGGAVFVGDTPDHDIAGAAAVGMRTVLLLAESDLMLGRSGADHQPDHVIRELPELLDILA